MTRIHRVKNEFAEAAQSQENLVQLILENPQVLKEPEITYLRSTQPLKNLYMIIGEPDKAYALVRKVAGTICKSKSAELLKLKQLWPFHFDKAIEFGDVAHGQFAIEKFTEIIRSRSDILTNKFVTQNLYKKAKLLFSIGQYSDAEDVLFVLNNKYGPDDFYPRRETMSRFLEIVTLLLQSEKSQAKTKIRSLKNRSEYENSPFFEFVIQSIGSVLKAEPGHGGFLAARIAADFSQLREQESVESFRNYFEFDFWLESIAQNLPMSEIYRRHTEENFLLQRQKIAAAKENRPGS